MTVRNRLIGIFTSIVLAVAAMATSPAHAALQEWSFDTSSGSFSVTTSDSTTYTITSWTAPAVCPATLEIPATVPLDELADPETGDFPAIDSFLAGVFKQATCLSTGAAVNTSTGSTSYVTVPEAITAIPAGAFQNDNLVKGFDFTSETALRPSVGAAAFTCNLADCTMTAWTPVAYYNPANTTNWDEGGSWYGMTVRVIPSFEVTGTAAVLDRKHAKLFAAVTSSVDGTLSVTAVATIKVGKKWRTREICSKSIAIVGGRNTLIYCTAGQSVRASIRLRKIKVRQVLTFTQGTTGRELSSGSRITINRTR